MPAQMIFYLVSYDASYCERKYQKMQRISNSQKIQIKSIFEIFILFLKVVSTTFLLVCFLSQKESTCETRKNVSLFHFKSSFHTRENQILEF